MNCQSLFSGENKKSIFKCCLLKFLPSMLSIKGVADHSYMAASMQFPQPGIVIINT